MSKAGLEVRDAHPAIIPVADLRDGGPVRHAELHRDAALALREACFSLAPGPLRLLAPLADRISRAWLERSASPYCGEIARIAAGIGVSGAYLLNASYEWGCTARASGTRLRRTLDWPFAGLGRYVQVAIQGGAAGTFCTVTWPGYVGVLTALAPGRFAAALNQAPLKRWTRLRAFDHSRHALRTWRMTRHMPPAHLLRRVFETAPDWQSARRLLCETPVARPALLILAGVQPGQACLIERTETGATLHDGPVTVANDWQTPLPDWEPRACVPDPRADNRARRSLLAAVDEAEGFAWVAPPVLNANTRIAVEMDAARGVLEVQGFEADGPATRPLKLVF